MKTRRILNHLAFHTWQHESTQPMNIQAACHTAQDIHKCTQPIETRTACNTTKHTWTRVRLHNDRKWSASVRTPSRDRNSRHECRDPNTTLQHETRHTDSSTLEAARSHENADMMGVSGLCHKTMNNTRPKWQNPDSKWIKDEIVHAIAFSCKTYSLKLI